MNLQLISEHVNHRPTQKYVAGEPLPDPALFKVEGGNMIEPQSCGCDFQENTETTENVDLSYVFTSGEIVPVFPSLSLEKEFWQAVPPTIQPGKDLPLSAVFGRTENLYIAREICWVLQINRVDSYILRSQSDQDLVQLIQAVLQTRASLSTNIVTGIRGPMSTSDGCNGLVLPIIALNTLNYLSILELIAFLMHRTHLSLEQVNSLVSRLLVLLINMGESDENRALNYTILFDTSMYINLLNELFDENGQETAKLLSVRTQPAQVQGMRRLIDVIFTIQETQTLITRQKFLTVDVTGIYPYIARGIGDYLQ